MDPSISDKDVPSNNASPDAERREKYCCRDSGEARHVSIMVSRLGLEPRALALKGRCSAN